MKATQPNGDLINLDDCYIYIPNFGQFNLHALPDVSDSKAATYGDQVIIGRSTSVKTYAHSDPRIISMQIHMHVRKRADVAFNLEVLRGLQSAVYPRDETTGSNAPFVPPPVCVIKVGKLLSTKPLCVILKNYSVKFPTDVPWDFNTYTPWKFDIDTSWEVVYKNDIGSLPGQGNIIQFGG